MGKRTKASAASEPLDHLAAVGSVAGDGIPSGGEVDDDADDDGDNTDDDVG